ncbi:MAG: BACON domain-containing protein [Bacteroidales bacterium]|nr:BACON domain-containing protein [Bacteroidales bacterium]
MKYKHISCLLLLLATLCTTSCVEEVDFDNLLGLSSSKLIVTERVDFGGNETKANFSITASGDWSISGKPDWFNLSTTNGRGNADITITTTDTENPSASASRSATLTVTSGNRSSEVVVTQSAAQAKLSIDLSGTKEFNQGATSIQFNIETNSETTWKVSGFEDKEWISVSPAEGKGNALVTVNISENAKQEVRTTTISVNSTSPEGASASFDIKQTGPEYALPHFQREIVDVSALAESGTIELIGGQDEAYWEVELEQEKNNWLTIIGGVDPYHIRGYGPKSITIKWNETTSKEKRSVEMTLRNYKSELQQSTCTITQKEGSLPVVSVDKVKSHKNSADIICTVSTPFQMKEYGIIYRQGDSESKGTKVQIDKKDANGQYTYSITGLKDMTTYQVKAYAENGVGYNETEWTDFTTLGGKPGENDNNPPILQTKRRKSKK